MNEIISSVQALAEALHDSSLYAAYRGDLTRIKDNPALFERVLDFKKKQAALEVKRLQHETVTFDEEKYIAHLYAELLQYEVAKSFLFSEKAFLEVYHQAMDILENAIEIDVWLP